MNLEQLLEKAIQKAKLEAHPVGSYYFSDVSTPPSEFFGGTWVQIKDRFILTAGDTYQQGQTGGEATHKLTQAELPKTKGELFCVVPSNHGNYRTGIVLATSRSGHALQPAPTLDTNSSTQWGYAWSFGNDQPHNNLPPYVVTYCWKRTA